MEEMGKRPGDTVDRLISPAYYGIVGVSTPWFVDVVAIVVATGQEALGTRFSMLVVFKCCITGLASCAHSLPRLPVSGRKRCTTLCIQGH